MFSLIKQVFIVFLSFSESLVRDLKKCLNDEPRMVRPILINLNPSELKYYPFVISLDKCNGSCNVSSPKICVSKETKNLNVKVFNVLTIKNEAKTMAKQFSCDYKCKFNSTTCNSNQKWNNKTCQCESKNYHKCEKGYSWNPSKCICDNSKYLKSIADTSGITCDEIISFMDILYTKMINTIATNVTNTSSIICHNKKVRDCYILDTTLLAIILLVIITNICYHYPKHRSKQKSIDPLTI